jgi:hypothetical protein
MKIMSRPLAAGMTAMIVWYNSLSPALAQDQPGTNIQIIPLKDTSDDNPRERALSVQVQDKTTGPIQGAEVTFTVPDAEPGTFPNREKVSKVYSDPQGLAVAKGFQIAGGARRVNVTVDAFFNGNRASAIMTSGGSIEKFVPSRSKKAWIFGLAGAGAAVGAFFIVRSGRSPGSRATPGGISIRLGGPQVGAP